MKRQTTTETITELDQRTKDELQPPCEYRLVVGTGRTTTPPCDRPAEYALTLTCPDCGAMPTRLVCGSHLPSWFNRTDRYCVGGCGKRVPIAVVSVVRL